MERFKERKKTCQSHQEVKQEALAKRQFATAAVGFSNTRQLLRVLMTFAALWLGDKNLLRGKSKMDSLETLLNPSRLTLPGF